MDNLTGQIIKGYQLQERLGAGAFGVVYRAYQTSIGREVAVKVILPHYTMQAEFIRIFEREAQFVMRLEHPHIIPLYDSWSDADGAGLVMRYARRGNLRDALQDGPFDLQRAVLLLDQIASALSLAHRNGIIHRDLKSTNILLDDDDNIYVADFGIAKDLGSQQANLAGDPVTTSPDYLSPEEARGEPATPQTDIYSLGALMYEVLTGQYPFLNLNSVERMYKHLNDTLPPIMNLAPAVSDGVNRAIAKATAKNPAQRYTDVLTLAAEFREAAGFRFNLAADNVVEVLTPREQDVLRLLAQNRSNAEIAKELFWAPSTVRSYIKQINKKLHVTGRTQAIARARALNLLIPPASNQPSSPVVVPVEQFGPRNPYKGLYAFDIADQNNFFGRETLTEKLVKRLADNSPMARFLAIIGPSGSGKTSLLRAGLIPKLLQGALPGSDRWFMVQMSPRNSPLEQLVTALAKVSSIRPDELRKLLEQDGRGLLRATLASLPNDGSQLVLVIDQLEELFTVTEKEEERSHFLNLICEAVTDVRSRLYIIVALRADFYDRPLLYADFGEIIRNRLETVLPLNAQELERAVVEPSAQVGVSFESGLVASIVSDVNYQPGGLPLLEYALTELFERRQDRLLTQAVYTEIGGAIGAVAQRADEVFISLSVDEQEKARQLFLRLVTLGEGVEDTRRRVLRSDLMALSVDPDLMDDAIDAFAEVRLLSLDHDPATRRPTVELAHEALLREWKRLRAWLSESRHDIRMEHLLANVTQEWLQSNRDSAFVLRGSRLDQFQSWAAETGLMLSRKEQDYLDTSLAERERQVRVERERETRETNLAQQAMASAQQAADAQRRAANRLRSLVAVLTLFLVVAAVLTVFALSNRNDALAQTQVAVSRQLAAQAVAEVLKPLGNDEYAALLALRSLKYEYDPIADQVLTEAVDKMPLKAFIGHTDEIYSVAFSPDDHYVLTSSADHTARLWDIDTTHVIRTFNHDGEVLSAAFSPDGKLIATGCDDMLVRLWDANTGTLIRAFGEHTAAVFAVAFSPDGKLVASASDSNDTIVRLWDVATGQQVRTFTGHQDAVRSVAFSSDGKYLLTGGNDQTAKLWDVASGQLIRTLIGHDDTVLSVSFSPDGKYLLTGSSDNTAKLWDAATGQLIRTFAGHSNSVRSAAFSPDGKTVLTGSGDLTARLWDVETGQQIRVLSGHTDKIWSVAFSKDGRYALTGSIDRTARLWDIGGQSPSIFRGHSDGVYGIAFSPDGKYLLTGSADKTAILWQLATGQQIRTYSGYPNFIWSVAFSPDGKYVLAGGSDHTAMLWDEASGQQVRTFSGHTNDIYSVAFSPDGNYILTGSNDNTARLWEVSSGQTVRTFNHSSEVVSVAFSPDGKTILTGSIDSTVRLWDVNNGQQLRTFTFSDPGITVWGVAFSPDGKTIFTSGATDIAILWDTATGQQLHILSGHTNESYGAAFSPDGKFVLAGSSDHTAIVWDTATGQQLRTLSGHTDAVWGVAFDPDGVHVATGSLDGTARLWDIDYHRFTATACARLKALQRDFTDQERQEAHITDTDATCL